MVVVGGPWDYCVTPVPIGLGLGLGFGFGTDLGFGLRGPDLGLGLDNYILFAIKKVKKYTFLSIHLSSSPSQKYVTRL